MREKVTSYNFTVVWTPGKNHHIADALSRAPVFGPCEMSFEPEQLEHCLRIFDPSLTHMDPSMDDEYVEALQLAREGKNATHMLRSSKAYAYRRILDLLCIETYQGQDVLVYDGCRLVVPRHKRPAILALLHAGHSGIAKTYRTAIQLYYCASMKADIEQSVANCSPCQAQRQNNPRPKMDAVNLPGSAKLSMLHTACDLFSAVGKQWLALVDRFSGYAWTVALRRLDT